MLSVLQSVRGCEGHTALHNIFKQLLFLTKTISELVKEVVMVIMVYNILKPLIIFSGLVPRQHDDRRA